MRKTRIITVTAVLAIIAGTVVFNSCTKQDEAGVVLDNQTQHQEMTAGDMAFYSSITQFKQKIKYIKDNPKYKSGEELSIDSAIWLMEATFNYEYSSAGEKYEAVKADSAFLEIETGSQGEISLNELSDAYYEMFYEVQDIYNNTDFDNKGLVLVNLDIVSSNSNTTNLKIETVAGNKSVDPEPGVFGDDDYWRYGMLEGTCDFEQDTTDAARKIWFMTNAHIPPQPWPPPGYIYTYSDYVTWTVEGGDEKWIRPGDPDNYLDYYLYYADPTIGTITDEVLCLEPDEMNNYYNWLQNIIYDWLPQEPGMEDHVFLVISEFEGIPFDYPYIYKHQGQLEYAIMHLVPWSPPADPPLEDDQQN